MKSDDGLVQLVKIKKASGHFCADLDLDSHTVTRMMTALEAMTGVKECGKADLTQLQDSTVTIWRDSEICKASRRLVSILTPKGNKYVENADMCSQLRAQGNQVATRELVE